MKQMIIGVALLLNIATVYANDETPSKKILQSFKKEFATATNITWKAEGDNVYQFNFVYNEERIEACFDEDGALLSTARVILETQLPLLVTKTLSTDYSAYQVDRIEEHTTSGLVYYLVSVSDKKETVILHFFSNGDVQRIKRVKNKK